MEKPTCCQQPMMRRIRGKRGAWNRRAFWQCQTCSNEIDDFTSDDPEVIARMREVLPSRRPSADPDDRQEDYGFVPDDPIPQTSNDCPHCINGQVLDCNYQWAPCPHCGRVA